jgi:hypothetical protein
MAMPAILRKVLLLVLVGLAPSTIAADNNQAPPEGRSKLAEQEIRVELTRYYSDMRCSDGRIVPAYQTHFWPGATLATVWQPRNESKARVVVTTAEEFIKRSGTDQIAGQFTNDDDWVERI